MSFFVHAEIPEDNLLGHWKFDEGGGTTAINTVDATKNGVITGATHTSGRYDGGLLLQSNHTVTVSPGIVFTPTTSTGFTGAIWVNWDGSTNGGGMNYIFEKTYDNFAMFLANNDLGCRTRNSAGTIVNTSSATNIVAGTWYHVACVYTRSTDQLALYLDGELVTSITAGFDAFRHGDQSAFGIGNRPVAVNGSDHFTGTIDELRIYNRALSQEEVESIADESVPFIFEMVHSGAISLAQGTSIEFSVELEAISGESEAVALSATSLPSGLSITTTEPTCTPTCTHTVTIAATAQAALGQHSIMLQGESANASAGIALDVTISPIGTVGVCGNQLIESGEICDGGTIACTENGYAGVRACNVACTEFDNCTCESTCSSWSACSNSQQTRTCISTSCTSSSQSQACASNELDFAISFTDSLSLAQSSAVVQPIQLNYLSGVTQTTSLSVSGLPSGVTASVGGTNCSPSCERNLTLTASSTATTGVSTVTITATTGAIVRTKTFTLRVSLPLSEYYVCDCQAGAASGCVAGSDSAEGISPEQPKRTLSAAQTLFSAIAGGGAIYLCQGGSFDAVAGQRWSNGNCSSDSVCTITSYAPSWAIASSAPPIIRGLGNDAFSFSDGGNADHDEGYLISNLHLIGNGSGHGFFFYNDADHVTIERMIIDGFDIGIFAATGNTPNPGADTSNDWIVVRDSMIKNNKSQGWLGSSSHAVIEDNHFQNNGFNRTVLNHNIYISQSSQEMTVRNNTLYQSAIVNGKCEGVSFVVHGNHSNLLIQDNYIYEDLGKAGQGCWGIAVDAGVAEYSESFSGLIIERNWIQNVGNLGIGCQACSEALIQNNVIVQNQSFDTTGIGVPDVERTGDEPTTDVVVRNNTIYFGTTTAGTGIYLGGDEGSNFESYNNLIVSLTASNTFNCFNYDRGNQFYSRIDRNHCDYPNAAQAEWENGSGTRALWVATSGFDASSSEGDPLFLSAPASFELRSESPAVDAGVNPNGEAMLDIQQYRRDANYPDIGAYEFQHTFPAYCGNAVLEATESCDDGNEVNDDGCTAECEIESAAVVSTTITSSTTYSSPLSEGSGSGSSGGRAAARTSVNPVFRAEDEAGNAQSLSRHTILTEEQRVRAEVLAAQTAQAIISTSIDRAQNIWLTAALFFAMGVALLILLQSLLI